MDESGKRLPQKYEKREIKLTRRELEVLRLIVKGKSSQEVADDLFIMVATMKWHLANVYRKLGVSNRIQAFRRATRLGLIPISG